MLGNAAALESAQGHGLERGRLARLLRTDGGRHDFGRCVLQSQRHRSLRPSARMTTPSRYQRARLHRHPASNRAIKVHRTCRLVAQLLPADHADARFRANHHVLDEYRRDDLVSPGAVGGKSRGRSQGLSQAGHDRAPSPCKGLSAAFSPKRFMKRAHDSQAKALLVICEREATTHNGFARVSHRLRSLLSLLRWEHESRSRNRRHWKHTFASCTTPWAVGCVGVNPLRLEIVWACESPNQENASPCEWPIL